VEKKEKVEPRPSVKALAEILRRPEKAA